MRILVVEDAALVGKMYALVFPPREHELVVAPNGREALRLLDAGGAHFDLILLDLRMPDMDGADFIAGLRTRPAPLSTIPVILTTAEPEDSPLLQRAQALGVTATVRKPWKPRELRAVVDQVLGENPV